ncbi:hypothetical protein B0H10DRAFT_1947178 [Mycena sp. CBHHK59/15]|nr:hypothetical protein B0H10DRAFT_1947178 [Mycena sp. CBHHK59/15]
MASTFVPENIDPALLAMDPVNQMLERLRSGNPRAPASAVSDSNDMDEDLPAVRSSLAFNTTPNASSLVSFGSMVKHQFKLTDKSTVAFDQFVQAYVIFDLWKSAMSCCLPTSLSCSTLPGGVKRVITAGLSKKINVYTQAFILSPQLSAYRGLCFAEHILKAMREANILDLPPEEETANVDLIQTSLEPKSDLENIANLADKVLHGTSVKATLQFYVRLAFIANIPSQRWVMVEYPWLSEETFWLQVDEVIKTNSKNCTTKAELDVFYNLIYQQDIADHDDPANSPHQTTEFNPSATTWQGIVLKHSAKVLPNPKNPQLLLQAYQVYCAAQNANSNKRRRLNDEEAVGAQAVREVRVAMTNDYQFYIL